MKFKRGDKVNYLGGGVSEKQYDFCKGTYIWFVDAKIDMYIIEHPDGEPKSFFTDIPQNYLQEGLTYIFTDVDEIEHCQRFEVTFLIDVVSNIPSEYTRKIIVYAENEVDAIKEAAIWMTRKDSSNIDWIKNIKGNLSQVKDELLQFNYCFTTVIAI